MTTGAADLTRRRVRGRTDHGPALNELAERMAERWPWLDDGEEGDAPEEEVYVGAAHYHGRVTIAAGDHDGPLSDGNPLWILTLPSDRRGQRVEVVEWATDGDGRLARIEYVIHPRFRKRSRYKPTSRARCVLELWDYGLPVAVPVPDAGPPGRLRDLIPAARELRRLKREWERST